MGKEGSAGSSRKNLVLVTLEDTKGQKTINDNLMGLDVEIIVNYASLETIRRVGDHVVNNIVYATRLLTEFAVDRKGSCLVSRLDES